MIISTNHLNAKILSLFAYALNCFYARNFEMYFTHLNQYILLLKATVLKTYFWISESHYPNSIRSQGTNYREPQGEKNGEVVRAQKEAISIESYAQ